MMSVKSKISVGVLSLLLLLSGMLVAVGSEATDGEKEIDESLESESGPMDFADSSWPTFGHDRKRTSLSPHDTSHIDGTKLWEFETHGDIEFSSPVIGEDGTIYAGSWEGEHVYAINPNGTEKWSFETGGEVRSSPTVGEDGTIYIGSWDGNVYAINPDGTEKWSFETEIHSSSSAAIGEDGTIYIGDQSSNMYAINPDGTEKWTFSTGGSVTPAPTLGEDGTIYFGSSDHHVYAVNPDGTEKWSYEVEEGDHGQWVMSSAAIGEDGTVYIGSSDAYDTGTPGYLHALNPEDGSREWKFKTGNSVRSSPAIGEDGTIYVGSVDGHLYAINPNGTEKWSFETGSWVRSSPAIGADGTIYVGSLDNHLYAVNPDGTKRWSFETGSNVDSSPAIGEDGTIYVGSSDDNLYAIGGSMYNLTIEEPSGEGTVEVDGTEITSFPYEESFEYSTELQLNATPSEGWYFEGWTGDHQSYDEETTVTMDADKTVQPNFDEFEDDEEHVLSIEKEGGGTTTPSIGNHPYADGVEATVNATPSEGWYFEGWTGDHTSEEEEIKIMMNEDKAITAHFEECFALTIEDITGEGTVEVDEEEVTETPFKKYYLQGETADLSATPDEGWYFEDWEGIDESEAEITLPMDEDVTIDSVVFEEYATLTIEDITGEGTVVVDGDVVETPFEKDYLQGETADLSATPDEGWYFEDWVGIDESEADITLTMDEGVTIDSVVFEEYATLTIEDITGEGTVVVDGDVVETPFEKDYLQGETADLSATPDEGWYFEDWVGIDESETDITLTMDEDVTIDDVLFEEYVTLAIEDITGEGTVVVDGDVIEAPFEKDYLQGETADLSATPDEGWYFDGWEGVTEDDADLTIVMDDDKELTAHFEIYSYDLEVSTEGEGSVEIVPDQDRYEYGTEVELTAVTEEGWNFDRWTGDYESLEDEITVMMDEEKELTAHFEIYSYDLEVSTEGEGSVEIVPDQDRYEHGTEVELTAVTEEGWYFDGWTGDIAEGEEEEITVTMDENKEITANFEEEEEDEIDMAMIIGVIVIIGIILAIIGYMAMKGGKETDTVLEEDEMEGEMVKEEETTIYEEEEPTEEIFEEDPEEEV